MQCLCSINSILNVYRFVICFISWLNCVDKQNSSNTVYTNIGDIDILKTKDIEWIILTSLIWYEKIFLASLLDQIYLNMKKETDITLSEIRV